MDEKNIGWIGEKGNFYFKYKQKVIENLIVGSCLNVGCGKHKIKGAENVDFPKFDTTNYKHWKKVNEKYDTVILSDVIEHIKDDDFVWIKAVINCKKRVIITVPAYQWLFSNYDWLLGHFRIYDTFNKLAYPFKTKVSFLFGMLLPLFIIRKFTNGKTPKLPKWINTILYWLSHIRLPFGSTMLIVIDKVINT